ncbi:hypothetical protein NMG60_11009632 [Bertholletia excelsa]
MRQSPTLASVYTPSIIFLPSLHHIVYVMAIHEFHSRLRCSLQTLSNSLFRSIKLWAVGKNAAVGGPAPTNPCSVHAQQLFFKMSWGQVQVVMEKLGIFYDPDGDELGEIGLDETAALFEEGKLRLEDAKEAFDVFDENSDGFIDAEEVKRVICLLGFREVSEAEGKRMIGAFDENGDGKIDFAEFVKLLEKSTSLDT